MTLHYLFSKLKGGPGSGNHDHSGIKGHRGGSAPKKALSPDERMAEIYSYPSLYGEELLSGTMVGDEDQAENWLKGSEITETLYHGSQRPSKVLEEGFEAGIDEVIDTPGISLAFDSNYSKDYTGDNGKIFKVKAYIRNPVEQWDPRVKGYEPNDPADFDRKAKAQGFDAIISKGEVRVFSPDQLFIIGRNHTTSNGVKRFIPQFAN